MALSGKTPDVTKRAAACLHGSYTVISPPPHELSSETHSAIVARLCWYAIRTKSNCEHVAAQVLGTKGYEKYVPSYRSRRRWSDRVVETEQPLFPGYVFCRFDPEGRILPILTTPGVVSIVRFGALLTPIADAEIEAVQTVLRSGLATEPWPFLREGQRIRINRGSLNGLEGILVKKRSEWRMVVSITMLQRSISVEIDREWISRV